jgi:hypothetical protein
MSDFLFPDSAPETVCNHQADRNLGVYFGEVQERSWYQKWKAAGGHLRHRPVIMFRCVVVPVSSDRGG